MYKDHKPSASSPPAPSRGSSMSQDRPLCGRHTFTYKVIRRDVTPDDRNRDKGNRRRNTLWWTPSGYKEYLVPSDRMFSTYTQRHPAEKYDPVEEENLGPEPVDPYEEPDPEEQMNEYRDFYPSEKTTRFNASEDDERIREKLHIEADLVSHSKGKLDPKMIDLVTDEQTMSEEKRRIHKDIYEVLVNEMGDVTSQLGKIVQEIASFGTPGREQEEKHRETELQDLFVCFANIIAVRMLSSDPRFEETMAGRNGSSQKEIFRSRGSSYMYADDFEWVIPLSGKLNTRIDVVGDDGTNAAFGEVKVTLASELKDRLLGQILRYLSESFRHGSIAGINYFFTLCGPSLRLWYADASAYGSSAAYSFANKDDYAKIVDIVAFLCGLVELIYNRWMLEEGATLEIMNETHQVQQYTIKDVKRLFTNGQILGSRTVVWAANIEAQSDGALKIPTGKDLQLIIKSASLERDLVHHELDVLEWIQRKGKLESGSGVEYNIPIPIGRVLGTSSQPLKLEEWVTFNGQKLISTIATFCVRATRIPDHIDIHQLWAVARSLLQTLRFLHRAGIHYRDLHPGNILMTEAAGPQQCVLVDFGNARILKARRGELGDIVNPLDNGTVNKQDCRAGNDYFMSRRVHGLSEDMKKLGRLERGLPAFRRGCQGDPHGPEGIAAQETDIANKKKNLENSAYNHRYLDDWESALYWLLFQANASLEGKKPKEIVENCLTQILHLDVKKNLWSDTAEFRAATCVVIPYTKAVESWRALVDQCQTDLDSPASQNDPDRPAAVIESGPDPKEMACFDKIIQIVQEAELRFAPKEEHDLMGPAGPSIKRAYPDQPDNDYNKRSKNL